MSNLRATIALIVLLLFVAGREAVCQTIGMASPNATIGEEQFFLSDGVILRYLAAGRGAPVILLHGWSASAEMWGALIHDLSRDHQVIALDCRGHGKSDKPHEAKAYGEKMVSDVVHLMDHLGLKKAHIIGYSMGGSIAMKMLVEHPDRLLSAVIGGSTGFRRPGEEWDTGLIKSLKSGMPLSEAMIANRPPGTPEPSPQQRAMMWQMDAAQDSIALAAQRLGNRGLWITDEELQRTHVPVLVVYGSLDSPGSFNRLRKSFSAAQFTVVEGERHGSVPDSPVFVEDVREFLSRQQGDRSR